MGVRAATWMGSMMRYATVAAVGALTLSACGDSSGHAGTAQSVAIAPASRVETIDSPEFGLADQQSQTATFPVLSTSLITVANRGGTGHRSFLVSFTVEDGGRFSFAAKENSSDVTLPLTQPIPISAVTVRCDSFSAVPCQYTVSLVGSSP